MAQPGRNERCPCGSGKKFKRCCLAARAVAAYTRQERASAWARLERFLDAHLGPEEDAAREVFWGRFLDRDGDLDAAAALSSDEVFDAFFAFDLPLAGGRAAVDRFLEAAGRDLPAGERAYLEMLRGSTMRLYEVMDAVPGRSLTLRDVLEGDQVTVHEQRGSRELNRFDWIAARVVPRGASGQPEIEAGVLAIPPLLHSAVRGQLGALRASFLGGRPGADVSEFYKASPPFFHDAWVGALLEPFVPELRNTDGEPLVATRVTFDVLDAPAMERALETDPAIERIGAGEWGWSGQDPRGAPISLGRLERRQDDLTLETNSVERGARGRRLVEALAGAAVRHRATTHEDVARRVREALRSGAREAPPAPPDADPLPPGVAEDLMLGHYARYYRAWLDDSIPALEGRTPRQAARDAGLRPRLVELIHDLERDYQRSLRRQTPAYDPSWMWAELGLEAPAGRAHPPPLAHERVAELVPGSGELSRDVAARLRGTPGFEDAATVLDEDGFRSSLDLQRFLRERAAARTRPGDTLAALLRAMVNHELHRRKTFWVDEALAYTLDQTDLDVRGRELRVPFPSFALVFTDRHVLSLAERLLAADAACPLAGVLLKVATVYVTELRHGDARTLEIGLALDALGADPPHLVRHAITLQDDAPVEAYLDTVAPRVVVGPAIPDSNPLRGLLRVTINAILYATSAGVERQARAAPVPDAGAPRRVAGGAPAPYSSDAVYFLPGTIDISRLRRQQELGRLPEGRAVLRRFMVRGHWRRPAPSFADQRLRWIAPYWKGPDLAAVIERTYRLKP